jgi:nucleotide-binding universal stress UspA family protein
MSYKNVIVCTDYNDLSLSVLKYASSFSKAIGANLSVVHVCESFDDNSLEFQHEDKVADGKTYKELVTENLTQQMELFLNKANLKQEALKTHIAFGDVKEELNNIFEKNNYDLSVFGQHTHNFLTEILLGSVTEKILQVSPIDVLVVRNADQQVPATLHTPLDFTKLSEKVIKTTKELAVKLKAKVTISHLVELDPQSYLGVLEMDGVGASDSIQKTLEEEEKRSEEKLNVIKEQFTDEKIETVAFVQTAKDFRIAENIIDYEDSVEHDLTIIGAHGKNVFEKFFFGSTAATFLEQTKYNILVVKK